MNTMIPAPSSVPSLRAALRLAVLFAAIKLLFQFALTIYTQHIGYGYFRDEFYYIACGRHLAWGYVDQGPVVAVQARVGELLFGDSVFGIRVLSALAGALTVFFGGIIAWALGGRRPAQSLAMIALILCPQYIGVDGFLSMNSCEAVFWSACLLAIIMIARGSSPMRWWIFFGIAGGIGTLNKPQMAFFFAALLAGLIVTPHRRLLFTRWAALGVAIVILCVLPFLHWQIVNHWPTLEFLHNGRANGKNAVLNPLQFLLAQLFTMGPLNALVWIAGVVALLRAKSIRDSRWLGFTYVFFLALMCVMHAKDYYLEGIYPAFFAAGGIAWEHRFASSKSVKKESWFAFPVYESLLFVGTMIILPMASPVFAPATWVRYTNAMHLPHDNTETASTGPLPQFFADRFIWKEQVDLVNQAFKTLSPYEQQHLCLFASNYGEAGALDFLGRIEHLGLPSAISGQNNYYLWGTHGCDINVAIAIVHDTPEELAKKYDSVTLVGNPYHPYAMPFENHRHIYLLRGRKPDAPFRWEDERFYY